MNIAKNIVELTQYHDCVIIPDFGGFIANYVPARLDETVKTLLPPTREIIFNPKINRNDGVLIHYLTQTENITYQQALQMVQAFCDQSVKKLYNGEKIYFEGLGNISFNHSGSWVFDMEPNIMAFEAYGLPSLTINKKAYHQPVISIKPQPSVQLPHSSNQWLRIAASVMILLALSFFPKPGKMPEMAQTSNILPITTITLTSPEAIATVSEEQQVVNETTISEPDVTEEVLPYVLVGGSFTRQSNAENLYNELKELGYKPELYQLKNGWYRVNIGAWPSWDETVNAMEEYRLVNPESSAWASKR